MRRLPKRFRSLRLTDLGDAAVNSCDRKGHLRDLGIGEALGMKGLLDPTAPYKAMLTWVTCILDGKAQIPADNYTTKPLLDWSKEDVDAWAIAHGQDQYSELFLRCGVSGKMLVDMLTNSDDNGDDKRWCGHNLWDAHGDGVVRAIRHMLSEQDWHLFLSLPAAGRRAVGCLDAHEMSVFATLAEDAKATFVAAPIEKRDMILKERGEYLSKRRLVTICAYITHLPLLQFSHSCNCSCYCYSYCYCYCYCYRCLLL